MNFFTVLLLLTVITGLICLFDSFSRRAKRDQQMQQAKLVHYSRVLFPIVLAVLLSYGFMVKLLAMSWDSVTDFPAILVSLVFITGLIWLFDKIFWQRKRSQQAKEPKLVEYSRSFFPIILAVLVIRSFIAEPFQIPSGSMLPTLRIGDFILVNKFSYGVRLPVINTKIIDVGAPQRGDVAVFRYPEDPKINYIKRIVGLPGDKIAYFNKTIYINGVAVERTAKAKDSELIGIVPLSYQLFEETLGEQRHDLLINPSRDLLEGEQVIPGNHYFVIGDNRDNSRDSRVWGTVPEENLVGKAFFIWMSLDGGIVWDRIGNAIN